VHKGLTRETIKAKDVKHVIIGDMPDMSRARFVRVRRGWGG